MRSAGMPWRSWMSRISEASSGAARTNLNQAFGEAANQARRYAAEDIVCGEWTFASGVRGVGQWCFSGGSSLDRVEIVGVRGRVTFATFDERPVVLEQDGVETAFDVPHPPHVQQPLIQTIVDELHGVGRCPSTGESGARTTAVMDRLLESFYR